MASGGDGTPGAAARGGDNDSEGSTSNLEDRLARIATQACHKLVTDLAAGLRDLFTPELVREIISDGLRDLSNRGGNDVNNSSSAHLPGVEEEEQAEVVEEVDQQVEQPAEAGEDIEQEEEEEEEEEEEAVEEPGEEAHMLTCGEPNNYSQALVQDPTENRPDILIGGKYLLTRILGSGSFGEVYSAVDIETDKDIAIKLEWQRSRNPQLEFEAKLYKYLQGGPCIPKYKAFGSEHDYRYLALQLLGPSLEDLLRVCSGRFTLKTVLMLADQMISRVEFLHTKGYIHRDIKPENFLMGINQNARNLFLIDFGLTKKYCNSKTGVHIPHKENKNKSLVGTARYASLKVHFGWEASRRDDLESLGYCLVYFLKGSLPWQGIQAASQPQRHDKIREVKLSTSVKTLCKGLPDEFSTYIDYCYGLDFDAKPNYGHLRQIFNDLFIALGYRYDYVFDWQAHLEEEFVRTRPLKQVPLQQWSDPEKEFDHMANAAL